ncbi:hypothetical protein K1719_009469 [Acacia pycnantha]|nr:hypothetical protein K1719_009469 [Acacia pycnantha]
MVFHIAPIGSDHHILVVDCCFCELKTPRPFRFEAVWVQHVDFLRVVKEGWANVEGIVDTKVQDLVRRLEACKEKLLRQLEEAWSQEEMYWWQKSRISWLECVDQNTKFFHSSVIQRRQRNKILRLKDERGIWLEEMEEINNAFNAFYQNFFSVGPQPMEQTLGYVNSVVTNADNSSLMKPITSLEIEEVVFQIGANKALGPDG